MISSDRAVGFFKSLIVLPCNWTHWPLMQPECSKYQLGTMWSCRLFVGLVAVVKLEPRALSTPGKGSTTEP